MATEEPGSTTIKPLTPDTWNLFAALVERHKGIFGGCWCVKFHPERADHVTGYDGNRAFKRCMVEEGIAHAALVVRDGEDGEEAIAWAEYGTPAELPDIHHNKQYLEEQDLEPDYRITCIFVDKRFRQHGLVAVALEGALALIAQAGGGVVEGYPHDLTNRDPAKKINPSFLYNLTRHAYEEAGFTYVRPKGQGNCAMTRTVPAAARSASR